MKSFTRHISESSSLKTFRDIWSKMPQDLKKIVYSLKSQQQGKTHHPEGNVLKHTIYVTRRALKTGDVDLALAAIFHDIGKAIDYETEGSHDVLSREILLKYKYPENIIHAVYAHHDAEPCRTVEAFIIKAADAISAGRPGARQESLEKYLERISFLEETAASFKEVKKSFAISAGRELRIIVDPEEITDKKLSSLATDVAEKIEQGTNYPGKIKINVIRRIKYRDYAK